MSERITILGLVDTAVTKGARQHKACEAVHISARTLQRWRAPSEVQADGRITARRPSPRNRTSPAERKEILALCHRPEFASESPAIIVPKLADRGVYVASESTFYRVLRAHKENARRGRASTSRKIATQDRTADGPNQVWSWDITWLAGPAKGLFFYLYMFLDVWSRKIVGWEVYEEESGEHAAHLIHRTVLREGMIDQPLVLHSDNGSPMKAHTMLTKLDDLGVTQSLSRPRVSNDNAYVESFFKTLKYVPAYPRGGFRDLTAARQWMQAFVHWYNTEHLHSGIQYVTPVQAHDGSYVEILEKRRRVYTEAKDAHPERWSGECRAWSDLEPVRLVAKMTKEEMEPKKKRNQRTA